MVSEVVATRSRGCEKTVNLVGRDELNPAYQDSAKSITRQPITADFSRTQIICQTHYHAVMGGVWERV